MIRNGPTGREYVTSPARARRVRGVKPFAPPNGLVFTPIPGFNATESPYTRKTTGVTVVYIYTWPDFPSFFKGLHTIASDITTDIWQPSGGYYFNWGVRSQLITSILL
jgi:hypothetical protein